MNPENQYFYTFYNFEQFLCNQLCTTYHVLCILVPRFNMFPELKFLMYKKLLVVWKNYFPMKNQVRYEILSWEMYHIPGCWIIALVWAVSSAAARAKYRPQLHRQSSTILGDFQMIAQHFRGFYVWCLIARFLPPIEYFISTQLKSLVVVMVEYLRVKIVKLTIVTYWCTMMFAEKYNFPKFHSI